MITAVSNFKENNLKVNLNKNIANNNLSDLQRASFNKFDFSQPASQVSFKGLNTSKIGKNILGDIGSNMVKKVIRFAEETAESVRMLFRKLKGQDELPFSEKPITCNGMYNEKMQRELEEAAKQRVVVNARKKDVEELIKKSGNSVSSGDIDQSGYITISGQHKVDNPTRAHRKHHEDFDNNPHDETSFKGKEDNLKSKNVDDINDTDKLDNAGNDLDNIDKADLDVNDGINDIDDANLAHLDDLNIDRHNLDLNDLGGLEKLSLEDFDAHKLDTDIDFDGHELDIDSHNLDLDVDDLNLSHADDLDIDSHNLDVDDVDLAHADDLDIDVTPDIDLDPDIDIDPSDLL